MSRLQEFIERLQGYGPHACLEGEGFSYTYSQLLGELCAWQKRLDETGIASGSAIAMRADYSLSAVAALLALMQRRTSVALLPPRQDTSRYLRDSHAAGLLDLDTDGSAQWTEAALPPSHPLIERLHAAGESGLVIFTSGSTGTPKAALQSVERFLHKFCKPGRRLRTLAFLLFDHVAGLDTLFYTLAAGGTLILTRRRDPESVMTLIEKHQVEVLPVSPSFLRLLCATKERGGRDLSSLKVITYGSEPMDPATLARVNAMFMGVQISQKYGTTETGSPRTVSRSNDSLWLKIKHDGVEARVRDGVLWIRSEGTILGYLNADTPLDGEGWYCTGDLVDVDGEWIRFRGRLADTINVGGEKVDPAEVERTILELDFVQAVAVSGQPHALLGQVVTARVALASSNIDVKEAVRCVRSHCREHLPLHKVPVRIDLTTEIPVSDRQKLLRQAPAGERRG